MQTFYSIETDQLFVCAYKVGYCIKLPVARVVAEQLGVFTVEEFELTERAITNESLKFGNLFIGIRIVGDRMVMDDVFFFKQR